MDASYSFRLILKNRIDVKYYLDIVDPQADVSVSILIWVISGPPDNLVEINTVKIDLEAISVSPAGSQIIVVKIITSISWACEGSD